MQFINNYVEKNPVTGPMYFASLCALASAYDVCGPEGMDEIRELLQEVTENKLMSDADFAPIKKKLADVMNRVNVTPSPRSILELMTATLTERSSPKDMNSLLIGSGLVYSFTTRSVVPITHREKVRNVISWYGDNREEILSYVRSLDITKMPRTSISVAAASKLGEDNITYLEALGPFVTDRAVDILVEFSGEVNKLRNPPSTHTRVVELANGFIDAGGSLSDDEYASIIAEGDVGYSRTLARLKDINSEIAIKVSNEVSGDTQKDLTPNLDDIVGNLLKFPSDEGSD